MALTDASSQQSLGCANGHLTGLRSGCLIEMVEMFTHIIPRTHIHVPHTHRIMRYVQNISNLFQDFQALKFCFSDRCYIDSEDDY